MRLRFYGTRGSLAICPTSQDIHQRLHSIVANALRQDVAREAIDEFLDSQVFPTSRFFGGNTSCVSLEAEGALCILDAGSGLRRLGLDILSDEGPAVDGPVHLLLSHYHWDHICGFPFFVPAFLPDREIRVHGVLPGLENAFTVQQSQPFFPIALEQMAADIHFQQLDADETVAVGPFSITPFRAHHPGGCFGYRIEAGRACLAYLTDTELLPLKNNELERYRTVLSGTDVAIVDSQYTFLEGAKKLSWGHSTIFSFIDICRTLDVKRLIMFHHDPTSTDEKIEEMEEAARSYQAINAPGATFTIHAAHDGMVIDLDQGMDA